MLVLLTMPLLGGGKCAFFYSSGDDNDEEATKTDVVVVVGEGTLVDAPVEGVRYESGSLAGLTGSNGEFRYEVGNTVRFFIGDIALGRAVTGKALVTPLDMVENGTADTTAVINIARLLQSLDSEPGDGVITIPPEVRKAAVLSNEALSSAIEFLDFSDEPAFVNAASQLVAVLASDYPFT
ncbi:MAG: hypothetical protein P8X93_06585, partial [Gammaproteobacteria bacterium]